MNTQKIAWMTDIHLNFLNKDERSEFYQNIIKSDAKSILITGDIAEAKDICEILSEMSAHINMPVYFVLGNHDYYFGSVTNIRLKITSLCSKNTNLIWLGNPAIIKLGDHTVLVGHDTWADARYGDFDHSQVTLNDSRLIAELYQSYLLNKSELKNKMQQLADADAEILNKTLIEAMTENINKVIIAVHVPPFSKCCLHKGKQSDDNWLPYFTSKATGDVISDIAKKHPHISFQVYCGHTHSSALFKPVDNLETVAGRAQYGNPEIQLILEY